MILIIMKIYKKYVIQIILNIEYRINESIIPIDFNIDIYKKLNKDLQNMTNQEAFIHYINNGYYENRKYKLYENLLNFTDKIM